MQKSATTQKPANAKNPIFDYVYQAAAFKSTADAEKLRVRLERADVRNRVQKSGKVYLVLVMLRGNEADARRLREDLASMKLGRPLQLSKKPVARSGGKKAR